MLWRSKRALSEGLSVNTIFKDIHLLTDVVVSANFEAVTTLLDAGADPDGTGSRVSPLHAAANFGRLDMVRLLAERGATVDGAGPGGETALLIASRQGHVDVVDLLLQLRANINVAAGEHRLTPLHAAAIGGHTRVAALLIGAGALVGAKASNGATPLVYALYHERLETADLLMKHSDEADLRNLANILSKKHE